MTQVGGLDRQSTWKDECGKQKRVGLDGYGQQEVLSVDVVVIVNIDCQLDKELQSPWKQASEEQPRPDLLMFKEPMSSDWPIAWVPIFFH